MTVFEIVISIASALNFFGLLAVIWWLVQVEARSIRDCNRIDRLIFEGETGHPLNN